MVEGGKRAGTLRRKIDLYKKTITENSSGQEVASYSYDFSLMSDPKPIRGTERSKSGREEMATLAFNFLTYFKKELTATHKVKFNGDFYDIQGIAPMGGMNRRFVEIYAELLDQSKLVIE